LILFQGVNRTEVVEIYLNRREHAPKAWLWILWLPEAWLMFLGQKDASIFDASIQNHQSCKQNKSKSVLRRRPL